MSSPRNERGVVPEHGPAFAEQIAVVGMACRLPRATDPDGFWTLLRNGVDAIDEVPAGRWPEGVAAGYRRGGFLDQVDHFDAGFFDVSPIEAAAMDPQQRLILELAWEALEQARIAPSGLRDSATSVFVGAIAADYAALVDRLGTGAVGAHTLTGLQRGLIANRVSYLLGLRGRSMTVDTGQSSSLVAVQNACEDLRRGDSNLALVGGVNLNLLPETSETIGRFGALSPDGRCYVFDERANGYVRGEGGVVLVLRPLADALARNDTVHCVILGGAVNNDGGGKGLTVPNRPAQHEVVRSACARAGVAPAEVQYVELHGTGTPVGDPIEAAALGGALGEGRDAADPLLVGSVKTNIGHLEGAAGITGLLKVVLSIKHRELAPSLNFAAPGARIPLADLKLDVVRNARSWPRPGHRLVAGVSSFGMGGTNCHLVLAQAPGEPERASGESQQVSAQASDDASARSGPLVLSARCASALRGQARKLADHLARNPAIETADVALSLIRTRARFEHRAVLLGTERGELISGLEAIARNRPEASAVTGRTAPGGIALVFPGQGAQWAGMAGALLDGGSPLFARRLDECAQALEPHVDFSLLDVLRQRSGAPDLSRVDVVQPALWAVMVALAQLWGSWGVRPDLVIGHSQGEIAAATAIGALRLEDGALAIALRSRVLEQLPAGGMLSIGAPLQLVEQRLAEDPRVTLAAVNGPRAAVVSGSIDALHTFRAGFGDEVRTKILPVAYASHSPAVDAVRAEILDALEPVRPVSVPAVFVSTVTGEPMDTAGLDADYWYRNLRQPVRFADATRSALASAALFVECSPHPVLVASVEETAQDARAEATTVSTLRRGEDGPDRLLRIRAEAYVAGAQIDWDAQCAVPGARLTDLPTYAFQREPHWLGGVPRPYEHIAAPCPTPVHEADDAPAPAPDRSRGEVGELVADTAAVILGHPDGRAIDPLRTFKELGFDSAGTVEFCRRLRALTGLPVVTSLIYDHPTPRRLADHLHTLAGAAETRHDVPKSNAEPQQKPGSAVIPPDQDAIAIVAIGCRYPGGVESAEDLWRLVSTGTHAITPLPTNRGWDLGALLGADPVRLGTCATRSGGFLHDADRFDAAFFGVSPREALAMDPQQRLLLETSWEALERAGLDPTGLEGSAIGVFVGAMAADYGPRPHLPTGVVDGHLLTGTALSVASGRISYTFGLRGPALTVDTACSSSLVAVHLAVQALRRGECTAALAGGVSLMSNPGTLVEFSRQNGLAPDGRVKAFSAAADGTAFAEGAAMLLLEPLSRARSAGHRVLAVIRGVAVNQDGASNGLTAPSGTAQQEVIRSALADARLEAHEVDAIEAHGTGTALGDPIEAHAILATYGRQHAADRPVWLGSVKSNLGHTQAAAGVAGVIKMVMAMRYGVLPRTLCVEEPTHEVDWDAGAVRLLAEDRPWPRDGRPRRAAISSFGISGTNAHLILEDVESAPATGTAGAGPAPDGPLVWVFSARSAQSLRASAERLASFARTADDGTLIATGPALARRAAFAHRAVVLAEGREQLCAALDDLAVGRPSPAAWTGIAPARTEPVFVFPGQGSQWTGMAAELLRTDEVFAASMRRCDQALAPYCGWSVVDVLGGVEGAPAMETAEIIQPALFAVTVSLAALWRSAGVQPAAVVGHSMGEIAAAHLAGALSLADAARLVALRSQVIGLIDGAGAVLSAAAPAEVIRERIEPWDGRLWVALRNGPNSTVIAGDSDAAEEFTERWGASIRLRRAALGYAAHTPHVARVRDALHEMLGVIVPSAADLPICSSYTGGFVDPAALGTDHWYQSLACQVRFDTAVRAFTELDKPLFIEISPHPILVGDVEDILADAGIDGQAVGSLRRGAGDRRQFLAAAAQAYVRGAALDWIALLGPAERHVEPPTYAFDRQRFWLESRDGAPASAAPHPLLDSSVSVAEDGGFLLCGTLSLGSTPWLGDHAVGGTVIVPGTVFAELALQAARIAEAAWVDELTLHAPLPLPETGAVAVQIRVGGPDEGHRTISVHSRPLDDRDGAWIRHASGRLALDGPDPAAGAALDAWPPAEALPVDLTDLYPRLADLGYDYGPAFQGLRAAWRCEDALYAEVRLPDGAAAEAGAFAMHPALLDAALHILVLETMHGTEDAGLLLPFSWAGLDVAATGTDSLRVRLTGQPQRAVELALFDSTGSRVGGARTLALRRVPRGQALGGSVEADPGLYAVEWAESPLGEARLDGRHWAVLGTSRQCAAIGAALTEFGIDATRHSSLSALADAMGAVPAVVVLPCAVDDALAGQDGPRGAREVLRTVLAIAQQWTADERFANSRLLLLADRAVPATAAVWGLIRCAQAEQPGRFVVADPGFAGGQVRDHVAWRLMAAALDGGETQFAVDGGRLCTARVARRPEGGAPVDLSGGTVLVTGGTGGLGALVAQRLVAAHGVRDLLLVSRRGPAAPGSADLVARLGERGATVRIEACDVADRAALGRLLASVPADRPLAGLIHAAGALDDGVIAGLSPARLDTVLRPKADAGWLLHELTVDLPLRAFVLFSSVVGIFGNAGQANYAAANTLLDALAAHRRALGLPATSIAWGPWTVPGGGMAAGLSAADAARLARSGLAPLDAESGLALFDAALCDDTVLDNGVGDAAAGGRGLVIAARWDRTALSCAVDQGTPIPPALRSLVRAPRRALAAIAQRKQADQTQGAAAADALAGRIAGLSRAEAYEVLLVVVREHVALALAHGSADEVAVDSPFNELGFDSLTSVELRNRLGAAVRRRLPATLLFDRPTVAGVAGFLADELVEREPAADEVLREAVDRALDRLDAAQADEEPRERVVAVLQAALARLNPVGARSAPAGRFDGVADEEIFQFIDNQL